MLKYILTIFIAILIPSYAYTYGFQNFLWFSDVSLFLIFLGLWLESSLLMGISLVLTLFMELAWNFDFFYTLITGNNLIGIADYMLDSNISLFIRSLSLFHILLPIVPTYYLYKWGYNKKSLKYALIIYWLNIIVCYLFTPVSKSINWVHHVQKYNWQNISELTWLAMLLVIYSAFIILPVDFLLKKIFKKNKT